MDFTLQPMIIGMFNYFTSFGASSAFEKNRLILTSRNLDAPQEHIMKKLLKTFEGEDEQTRSQIAFATIIKKILTSDSNNNWIYLLKNLVILDRVLEDMLFIQQIAELYLNTVEEYVQKNSYYIPLRTDQIIKNYWKLIKQTSKLLKTKKHILFYPRSQRSQFIQNANTKQILKQIQSLQLFFKYCFNLLMSIQSKDGMDMATVKALIGVEKSKLMCYIKIRLLYKLMGYYSSQMLCTNRFLTLLTKDKNMDMVEIESARNFKQCLIKLKKNSNLIIEFVQRNKQLKGFQIINYKDYDPMPGNTLLKTIQECISQRLNFDDNTKNVQQYISKTPLTLQIRVNNNKTQEMGLAIRPRKKVEAVQVKKEGNNPFTNWKSSYSQDFPQKQIMTVDLIMDLKKENKNERCSNYDDLIIYNERETCIIQNNQQVPDHLLFNKPKLIELSQNCKYLYSGLQFCWNSD